MRLGRHLRRHWLPLVLVAFAAFRLVLAVHVPLSFDEAYYWLWSKHLAAGYYDHPPMVALLIRAGTIFVGDTQLGVRLVPVLLTLPAAWAVWRAADILFRDRALADTAALYFSLTLMVAAGTLIVSPDAPLMIAAAFLLFFLAKVHETARGPWWLGVGAAAGLGLVSKYTALFFGASILAWLVLVPQHRRWLASPWPYLGGLLAVGLFAPVLLWNAEHGWVSLIKQLGRAGVRSLRPGYLGELIPAQIGLATPGIFALGVLGLCAMAKGAGGNRSARVLLGASILPLVAYFLWHALHDRVQGNWLSPIYPALAVGAAVAAHGIDWPVLRWPRVGRVADLSRRLAVPVALAMFVVAGLQAATGLLPLGPQEPTASKLAAGWSDLARRIEAERVRLKARTIVTTGYAATGWLAFYLPPGTPVIQLNERIRWVNAPAPDPELLRGPLLYVAEDDKVFMGFLRQRFAAVRDDGTQERSRRGQVIETYRLLALDEPRGDPIDRTPPPELAR
jgi:4-amino-4-deoxy-L-arabinose transferase-like glycosyltransferase